MKNRIAKKHVLKSTLALTIALALSGCDIDDDDNNDPVVVETPEPAPVTLRVMETTDIHMYLSNYDYFAQAPSETLGFVNTATLIKEARNEVQNSVLVDNGDLIQNSPLGDYEAIVRKDDILNGATHVAFKAMNLLDYDVANLGNHEFNFGLEFLDATLSGADFPYINANVYVDDGDDDDSNDENRYTPYYLQDKTVFDINILLLLLKSSFHKWKHKAPILLLPFRTLG